LTANMAGIAQLNELPADKLREQLIICCTAEKWADQMVAKRPFAAASVHTVSGDIWATLEESDYLQAFGSHPKIGEKHLKEKFGSQAKWAAGEQAGAANASEETIKQLAIHNESYFNKFGFVFLICATGKTAEEMLASLLERESNERPAEVLIAAGEQNKITTIRLNKLLAELSAPAARPPPLTTHVLDTALGKPAEGLPIKLELATGDLAGIHAWVQLGSATTNSDGRIGTSLIPADASLLAATYRITFDTKTYFEGLGMAPFYPEVAVVFTIPAPNEHYHIPLLLSPFGYSTYRGS
jgi:hydroxyisourate hydrolase